MKKEYVKYTYEAVGVAVIVALGAAMRLAALKGYGLADVFSDEARIALGAATILKDKFLVLDYLRPQEPPLSMYLAAISMKLFGGGLHAANLAPAISNIVSLLLIYGAGRLMFSHGAGLAAAGLAALLPAHITRSVVLYENCFTTFFAAALLFCRVAYEKRNRRAWLCAAGLFAGLGLSTNLVFLYVMAAFAAALLSSGGLKTLLSDRRALVFSAVFFVIGALPVIADVALNQRMLPTIFAHAGTEAMPGTALEAAGMVWARLAMAEDMFSVALRFGVVLWAIHCAASWRLDRRFVFLVVYLAAFIVMSIVTHSGLHEHHLMSATPFAVLIPGSLIWIIERRLPRFEAVPALLVLVVCVGVFAVRYSDPDYARRGDEERNREFVASIEGLDAGNTISADIGMTMLLHYKKYLETGITPGPLDAGIVSDLCNRFRACPVREDMLALDMLFRQRLKKYGMCARCENRRTYGFNDIAECRAVFERLVLELAYERGGCNFVICRGNDPANVFFDAAVFFETSIKNLESRGMLSIDERTARRSYTECTIYEAETPKKLQR